MISIYMNDDEKKKKVIVSSCIEQISTLINLLSMHSGPKCSLILTSLSSPSSSANNVIIIFNFELS